jgi:hypothetical protein
MRRLMIATDAQQGQARWRWLFCRKTADAKSRPENQESKELSDQALVVYKALHEQVSFLKKQQWIVTNYVALIYGAIFAVKKGLSPP